MKHCGPFLLALLLGCQRAPDKSQVLTDLVHEVAIPLHRALQPDSVALVAAVDRFTEAPAPATLAAARAAWKTAAVSWRGAYAFREGPVVETSALLRAAYWPPNPKLMQVMLDGGPLDAGRIQEAGIEAKGLFVIEALLFEGGADPTTAVTSLWQGPHAVRRVALLRVLASDVASYGQVVSGRLQTSGTAFATQYAAAGQQSLNRLVNQLIETIEGVAVHRLQLVLGLADSGLLKPAEVEGWASGSSGDLALAPLAASQQLYLGGSGDAPGKGLSALVKHVAPQQDEHLRAAFALAVAKNRALNGPLEQVVLQQRKALEEAAAATRALEIAVKTELVNALGVTLTFVSGDGD